MKDFTSFDSWDIAETIQSQYATSRRMTQVINAFWDSINPKSDIDLLYKKLVNPRTAEGWGLDIWGRIVAIGRFPQPFPISAPVPSKRSDFLSTKNRAGYLARNSALSVI